MKIDHFDVVLDKEHPSSPYIGGEFVVGCVKINVITKIEVAKLVVTLRGIIQTGWKQKKNINGGFESAAQVLNETLDLTKDLLIDSRDNYYLNSGLHTLSFQYKLPFDVVSSIEQENHGHVRYNIQALLEIPEDGNSEIVAERPLTIYSYLNLDAPHLLDATAVSGHSEISDYCGICRNKKRFVHLNVVVSHLGLFPGDKCSLQIEVDYNHNSNCCNPLKRHKNKATKCISVTFCQQITFKSRNRFDFRMVEEKSITLALSSQTFHQESSSKPKTTKTIDFIVPTSIPPTTVNDNELITCCYFYKVYSKHFHVVVPIIIGSVKTEDEREDDLGL
uniref:Arrestin_C domain-containing protein n=1 Tax=Rhabditophanes sp. KR3021 TaxID=114890 RepID=A0AC35TZA1_9BILA